MKLWAIYYDDELYTASYKQNVPFYDSIKGAEMAIQGCTNRRCLPIDMLLHSERYTQQDKNNYLEELKTHFTIHEFELVDKGKI